MKNTKTVPEARMWEYRMFWYFAYGYFQNEHLFNAFIGKLKAFLSKLEDLRHKKKWKHIELKNPIFIIGSHRSGTTILQQLLSLHSNIATPRTYSDMFDMFPILSKKYARPFIRSHIRRRIDNINAGFDSPQEAQGLIFRYFDKQKALYNQATSDDLKNYMRKLLYLEEKTRFLWKTPYLSIRVPEVFLLFPDAQFIYLHRDPVTCIDSKLKFIQIWQDIAKSPFFLYSWLVGKHEDFELGGGGYFMERLFRTVNLRYLPPDPLAITRDQLNWVERALRDLNELGSSNKPCFLSYSDLITDPSTSLRQLFGFLHLPDESEAIISKLEEIGMPLCMPESKINYIPDEKLPEIRGLCLKRMRQFLSGVDWKNWQVIGSIPVSVST